MRSRLPAGECGVVVKASTQELMAPRANVTLGQETIGRLTLKNGQLVLE